MSGEVLAQKEAVSLLNIMCGEKAGCGCCDRQAIPEDTPTELKEDKNTARQEEVSRLFQDIGWSIKPFPGKNVCDIPDSKLFALMDRESQEVYMLSAFLAEEAKREWARRRSTRYPKDYEGFSDGIDTYVGGSGRWIGTPGTLCRICLSIFDENGFCPSDGEEEDHVSVFLGTNQVYRPCPHCRKKLITKAHAYCYHCEEALSAKERSNDSVSSEKPETSDPVEKRIAKIESQLEAMLSQFNKLVSCHCKKP